MKIIEEGFFSRNKKVIVISVLIMFVSILAGAVFGYVQSGDNLNAISNLMSSGNVTSDADIDISSIDLFIHNFTVDLITIIGGVLFSVLSVILTVFNGVSVGTIFGIDLKFACASVLPHAVFEYLAEGLALAIAFKLTKIEINVIKNRDLKNTIKNHNTDFKDILTIFVFMVILVVVAAVIEGHITVLITNWAYGF